MLDSAWREHYAAPTMMLASVTEFHIVLAIHVATVVMSFGVIFARPLVFATASRRDPRSLPILHRIEYTLGRGLVMPGVLLVILTGIYMADYRGRWSDFFLWWGIGVVALIGAASAIVMIPTARRAEAVVQRDLRSSPKGVGGPAGVRGPADVSGPTGVGGFSGEYRALTRRLAVVSSVLGVLVLITMLFMGLEYPM